MPNPKRQHSRQRKNKRRTHWKIATDLSTVTVAGSQSGYNHRVDPITGYYKGKQIIDVTPRKQREAAKLKEKQAEAKAA